MYILTSRLSQLIERQHTTDWLTTGCAWNAVGEGTVKENYGTDYFMVVWASPEWLCLWRTWCWWRENFLVLCGLFNKTRKMLRHTICYHCHHALEGCSIHTLYADIEQNLLKADEIIDWNIDILTERKASYHDHTKQKTTTSQQY